MTEAVSVEAPAKINLRLCVLGRETSGFHALETLFCAISLADRITLREGDRGIQLDVDGNEVLGPPEQNLVVRAAERFYREIGRTAHLQVQLCKRIPAAAGLGGGSSDAAATLRALNVLHADILPPHRLLEMGSELGSDVPFFLCGSSLALAWGRGERLLTLPPLPARPVLIAHPGIAMPTPAAFRRLADSRGKSYRAPASALELEALARWGGVAAVAINDFDPFARAEIPGLATAVVAMQTHGAEIAMLSGSGAAVFGVFGDARARDAAAATVGPLGFSTRAAETLTVMPVPRVDRAAPVG